MDLFIENGLVSLGRDRIGDLVSYTKPKDIRDYVRKEYPEDKEGKIIISASQLSRFRFDFKIDDYVLTYDPSLRIYHVGKIKSDYYYKKGHEEESQRHIRKVEWIGQVPRDSLSISTKNTLGTISTIFEIRENARNDILSVLSGKTPITESIEVAEEGIEEIKEDIVSKANEFIKDKILSLDWEDMQNLVAALLRAMGYKTIVSERGSDRGRDVIASPDGLGLEEPRIFVEVKHRSGSMGAPEIRSFIGGLKGGCKGLYVSTGGFTKEAKYEADRSVITLTLVDSDLLVNLIIQYYDEFDSEGRGLVPLVKIYWPV